MGVGNFFSKMPDDIRDSSKLYGVELDSISGRIAQLLNPEDRIQIKGFEETRFNNNSFDVVIGNVPFGDYRVSDKAYDKLGLKIHDYFAVKSIDKVKPGGVVAIVTSKFTMDKLNDKARRHLAERCDLLGAVRLPNNAFKKNAGTETTTDILFFKKRETLTVEIPSWVHFGQTAEGIPCNQYFVDSDMIKMKFDNVRDSSSIEILSTTDGEFECNRMALSIYKDSKGKYHYAHRTASIFAEEVAFGIDIFDFSNSTVKTILNYNKSEEEFTINGKKVLFGELYDTVKNEMIGSIECKAETKGIKLTNYLGKIASDCYNEKDTSERKQLLINSFQNYRLIELEKQAGYLEYLYTLLDNEKGKLLGSKNHEMDLESDEMKYKDILNAFYNGIIAGNDFFELPIKTAWNGNRNIAYEPTTIGLLHNLNLPNISGLDSAGYSFIDINNDGINECIVSAFSDKDGCYTSFVQWMFSIKNDVLFCVLMSTGGSGYNYYHLNSDNNSLIYEFKDGIYPGSRYYTYYKYTFDYDWNRHEEKIYIMLSNDTIMERSYYYDDGSVLTLISEEEFLSIESKWRVIEDKPIQFKSFKEYISA